MANSHRRPHQRRALTLLQMGDPSVVILPEQPVPQASYQIDGVMQVGDANGTLGPLQPLVRNREVILEHYGGTPPVHQLFNALSKQAHRAYLWANPKVSSFGDRPPLLLVLTGGRPDKLLRYADHLVPWGAPGIYRAVTRVAEQVIVDTKNLARQPGTSLLRLTRTPKTAAEARRNCGRLLADPNVPTLMAHDILEFIVSNHIDHVAFPEGKLQVQLWYEGRDVGRQEGRQEGRDEGRRLALLEVAARLVPDKVAALEAIANVDELQTRLVSLIGG